MIFVEKWRTTVRKVIVVHILSITVFIAIAGMVAGIIVSFAENMAATK